MGGLWGAPGGWGSAELHLLLPGAPETGGGGSVGVGVSQERPVVLG